MYPKEERERILADWLESGLPMAVFCALPGRPSRQALRTWRQQAEAGMLDVPERRVRGRAEHPKHTRYPDGTKQEALALVGKGMRPCDAARRLKIPPSAIHSWIAKERRATMGPKEAPMAKKKDLPAAGGDNARIAELELQIAVLKEIIRDPKAAGPESLSNRRKVELGERLRRDSGLSLKELLRALKISKSTYCYQLAAIRTGKPSAEAREAAVFERVRHAFEHSKRRYGYRRVRASILAGADGLEPMHVSEAEVRRAMRDGNMVARRTRKKGCWSSYGGEVDARPSNVPLADDGSHDFSAPAPGILFVTDVTEFKTGGGKVYLSPILDCFDGMPTSWKSSVHPDSALCDASLAQTLEMLPKGSHPTVHTDGAAVYRSNSWKELCRRHGVRRSMSRKGCCPDNARAEGFFGALKEEFYNGRDWSRCPPERFMEELDAFIVWYRDVRLKAFVEDGRVVYDTISGRRRGLGYVA